MAAARFTVTLDLPTPPFPDATAITVVRPSVKNVCCWAGAAPPRSLVTSSWRSPSLIGLSTTSTAFTPGSGMTAAFTSRSMRSFSGHPSIVIRTCTWTEPSSTTMSFSIPMSSIGLPISGSSTCRRACLTSSWLGMAIILIQTVITSIIRASRGWEQGRRA